MRTYARLYRLRPADRIVCRHSSVPFIDHHLIYLGSDFAGNELLAENHKGTNVQRSMRTASLAQHLSA